MLKHWRQCWITYIERGIHRNRFAGPKRLKPVWNDKTAPRTITAISFVFGFILVLIVSLYFGYEKLLPPRISEDAQQGRCPPHLTTFHGISEVRAPFGDARRQWNGGGIAPPPNPLSRGEQSAKASAKKRLPSLSATIKPNAKLDIAIRRFIRLTGKPEFKSLCPQLP